MNKFGPVDGRTLLWKVADAVSLFDPEDNGFIHKDSLKPILLDVLGLKLNGTQVGDVQDAICERGDLVRTRDIAAFLGVIPPDGPDPALLEMQRLQTTVHHLSLAASTATASLQQHRSSTGIAAIPNMTSHSSAAATPWSPSSPRLQSVPRMTPVVSCNTSPLLPDLTLNLTTLSPCASPAPRSRHASDGTSSRCPTPAAGMLTPIASPVEARGHQLWTPLCTSRPSTPTIRSAISDAAYARASQAIPLKAQHSTVPLLHPSLVTQLVGSESPLLDEMLRTTSRPASANASRSPSAHSLSSTQAFLAGVGPHSRADVDAVSVASCCAATSVLQNETAAALSPFAATQSPADRFRKKEAWTTARDDKLRESHRISVRLTCTTFVWCMI